MLTATLLLQASLLTQPLYLEPEKPELRSLQHILLLHDDMPGLPYKHGRDREQALSLMKGFVARLEADEDFGELAKMHSNASTSKAYGSLGCFAQGTLADPFDEFLFNSEMNEVSEVFDLPTGIHLLKRVEPRAAIRQIQIDGRTSENRGLAMRLLQELKDGADFVKLVEEHSTDPVSAALAGKSRVYERGSSDTLLKLAAFRTKVGEGVSLVETPIGFHLIERLDPQSFPKSLWEDNFIRVRAILVSHLLAQDAPEGLNRSAGEAKEQADEIVRRVRAGEETLETIARRFNDDPGGKQRGGDLGWLHRQNPNLHHFYNKLFLTEPGLLDEPMMTTLGVVVLLRER